jgi:hypothetical protein
MIVGLIMLGVATMMSTPFLFVCSDGFEMAKMTGTGGPHPSEVCSSTQRV